MPLTPGLQLPFGVQPVNPVAVDSWSGPYTGVVDTLQGAIDAANSAIPSAVRFKSLEVRLIVEGVSRKFWYRDGISDTDLVEFIGGNGGYQGADTYFYVSGSTDGLRKAVFGGDVVVSGSLFDPTGLKYVKSDQTLQQGAVLFGSATGTIAQNADKIFWDNLQSRLGIGTSQPETTLTVSGSSRTIGDLSVTGSMSVTGSALPGQSLTYDLGSEDKRWNALYASTGSFTGPVTINGNLTVLGTQTAISSTIVDIGDNVIVLNSVSSPQRFGGMYVVDQDSLQTGSLIWDSLNDRWLAGLKDSEVSLVSGSGDLNRVVRWTGTNGVGSGIIYDNGTNVGIGTIAGGDRFTVEGTTSITGSILPGENRIYYVGSSEKMWKNVYSSTGSFGDLFAEGNLSVSGSSYLTGSVIALSDVFVSGSAFVTGSLSVSGSTFITGSLFVLADATVSGSSYVSGSLFVSGSSYLTGSVYALSDVAVSGSLNVSGSTSITGSLDVLTNLWVSGSLTVTGSATVRDSFTAKSDVYVTGTLYGDENLKVGDTILPDVNDAYDIGSSTNRWNRVYAQSFSGSLTKLAEGGDYLRAGNNITLTTGSNGSVTIATVNNGTITSVSAGTGLTGGGSTGTVSLAINPAIVARVDGTTFTGATIHSLGLSGSLTKLSDGVTNYLQAGSNITISTGSNGQVTISSTAGGGAAVVAGINRQIQFNDNGSLGADSNFVFDKSNGSVTASIIVAPLGLSGSLTTLSDGSPYLLAGSGITLSTGSMGEVTISSTGGGGGGGGGTIGPAEDGTYEDGLFTDFTSDTPIGTPIDRFNEVLLALAPPPAPRIRNVNSSNTDGVTAYLSFGASNNQGAAGTPYTSVGTTAGFSAVDVNGQYAPTTSPASPSTSGNNLRKGIYKKDVVIRGILNDNVTSYVHNTGVTNYAAKTFGNGDTGTLRLVVNGTTVYSINLADPLIGAGNPGSGTGVHTNGNGSGFIDLSVPGSGKLSTGIDFPAFKHRTGRYQIDPLDQRNGWNYARVVHVIGSNQYVTNYVEWVNDSDTTSLGDPEGSLIFEGSGSYKLSGVEYFMSGSLWYSATVTNAYKYVYDLNPITFNTSQTSVGGASAVSFSFPSQAKPTIDTAAGETHNKQLFLSKYSELHADYFLNGTVSAGVTVTHPLKSTLTNGASRSVSQILFYKLANTSTSLIETFRAENYRLLSGSYDTQSDVTDSSNSWNSSVHMLSTQGYSDGLQFYNQKLLSPKNTLNGGNFSSLTNAPSGNPNYSGVSGKRTFYRWFRNTTGSSQYDLSLSMNGSSTIVPSSTSLSSGNLRAYVKIPGQTGWMDVALPYVYGADYSDGAGLHTSNGIISFDNTLNAINYLNLGNLSIANNEYIVLKIEADSSWTGEVSLITVTFGAGIGTLTPVPDLSNIDCDVSGIAARLSFGLSKSITGYANSSTDAGFTAVDLNGSYGIGTSGNNLRRGIFSTVVNVEGDLNESENSPGNDYVNNAFSDADTGVLRLEVNGSEIHSVDLSTFTGTGAPGAGTETSLNANLSGFISVSTWGPGLFDNGVPRYTERQRTARYRVTPSDQRNGWNYLRVVHRVGGVDRVTNYVEWINAPDTNALSSGGNELSIFGDDSFSYVSGVKYFNSPSGSILTRVSNIYRNVYTDSASAVSFTSLSNATAAKIVQSGNGITSTKTANNVNSTSLQTLNTSTDSQNEVLHVTGTINFTIGKSLPGTWTTAYGCAGAMTFQHPHKTALTTPVQSTSNLLVWTPSDTSNANTDEYFTGETYRLVDATYNISTSQTVLTNGTRSWNSQRSMNDQTNYPEHATGLLVYDTYLMAPKNGGASGDFRNYKDGGSIESPQGNVDYSSLTNSTRTFYRSFLNNTSGDANRVRIILYGDATWKAKNGPNAGTLGANKNIWVHVGIPGKCGLLDTARPTEGDSNFNEDDGALVGTFNTSVTLSGVNNLITFNGAAARGTASVTGSPERIVVRITASKDWTGYLDRIAIVWGG